MQVVKPIVDIMTGPIIEGITITKIMAKEIETEV